MNANTALQQYRRVGAQTAMVASPHRLIQMLMEGALEKITAARVLMEQKQIQAKGEQISWAISIIGGLRGSLDHDAGGEIASNLDALYDYMERRLLEANGKNDPALLDEVKSLLLDIKEAWDAIAPPNEGGGQPAGGAGGYSV